MIIQVPLLRQFASLSGNLNHTVRNLVATIDADKTPVRGDKVGFSPDTCYGSVGHYLRTHWDDSWIIHLFSFVEDSVEHACLYDDRGRKIVDTFRGKITKDGYLTDGGELYPEVAQIHLKDLRPYIRRLA